MTDWGTLTEFVGPRPIHTAGAIERQSAQTPMSLGQNVECPKKVIKLGNLLRNTIKIV